MTTGMTQDFFGLVTLNVGASRIVGSKGQQVHRYPTYPIMRSANWEVSILVDHQESLEYPSSHVFYFTEPCIIIAMDMSIKMNAITGGGTCYGEASMRVSGVGELIEVVELIDSFSGEAHYMKDKILPHTLMDIFVDTGDFLVPFLSFVNTDVAQDGMTLMAEFNVWFLEKR